MSLQQFIFYAFALLAVFSAVVVVTSKNPVISALFLVMTFFASAGLWLLAQAEFLSLILILVYVGAVMTLFLFVIMMLNLEVLPGDRRMNQAIPLGLGVVAVMVLLTAVALQSEHFDSGHLHNAVAHPQGYSNTQALGLVLYTDYVFALEAAAVLLLVAIIAAIALTHRPVRNAKTQNPSAQIRVKSADRLRIIRMPAEKP